MGDATFLHIQNRSGGHHPHGVCIKKTIKHIWREVPEENFEHWREAPEENFWLGTPLFPEGGGGVRTTPSQMEEGEGVRTPPPLLGREGGSGPPPPKVTRGFP